MRVLISGAGIAGPTLTHFLQRAGATVIVLEKTASVLAHGQNVDTGGAAITAVRRMGHQKRAWQHASRADRATQESLLRKDFADAGWEAELLLESTSTTKDFYFQAVQQIRMAKWSDGRVICLGDTAFAPTPLTGQGSSLAVIGTYLGGELSKLKDGEHPREALEKHEDLLRPFVEQIQEVPWFLPGLMHPGTGLTRCALQNLLWGISKVVSIPWVARRTFSDAEENTFGMVLPDYTYLHDAVVGSEKVAR